MTILRGAVEATERDNDWASTAADVRAVKRGPPIDRCNYGVNNLAALFFATGLFGIMKIDNGQSYVADKRN